MYAWLLARLGNLPDVPGGRLLARATQPPLLLPPWRVRLHRAAPEHSCRAEGGDAGSSSTARARTRASARRARGLCAVAPGPRGLRRRGLRALLAPAPRLSQTRRLPARNIVYPSSPRSGAT
eukprot:scaffold1058_cov362-Prasinococcus_capsulatus_cf.AAC.17